MICPAGCDDRLVIAERRGIEIDYCPACRGVWLDRRELDKIIDCAAAQGSVPSIPSNRDQSASPSHDRNRDRDRPSGHDTHCDQRPRKKKRGGFLEDLFEF